MTDDHVRAALNDWQALTITLFGEAAIEPIEGKVAVGSVVRNRVKHPTRYGATYRAVCIARAQFSCLWKFGGASNYARVMGIARSFAEGSTLPSDLSAAALASLQECGFVAEGIIGGQLRSNVGDATHYYAPLAMKPKGRVPEWAKGLTPIARKGAHIFYAGVA